MSDREMLASAVVTVARDKLVAALGDPAVTNTMRENLVSELEETKDEMESILVVLRDAERRSIRQGPVRLWLQRLQRAAYDVWDMVDEIRTNKDAAPMASRMLPLSRANNISSVRQALHKIFKEQCQLNLKQHFDVQNQSYDYDHRKTFSDLPKVRVVGMDEQVERILDFLLSPARAGMSDDGIREWPVFLPIFGLAGIGKTTLAQLVYNHRRSRDYFDARAWVCLSPSFDLRRGARAWVYVSPSFDLRRIGVSIISQFPRAYDGERSINVLDNLDSITRRIHELVGDGKKVLLVLDDIWVQDQQELDRLKSLLGVGTHGSSKAMVIVTTRDENIARRICTNKQVQPYKVHPLSDDQCWEVIKQASRFELKSNQSELGEIGREMIATKCGGLPLAAQALGFRLRSIDSYEEWLQIASTDYIKLQALEFFIDDGALSLSYQSMPPNLRLCFAYLGTLPERQNMAEDDIIHRWIALGLIEPKTNGISTGQQIISRLLDISFLEHSNLASTSRKHDDKGMISFSMNSLIHDFARSLMSSTLVVANGEHTRDPWRRRCRCAVLTNFDLVPSKLSGMLPAELRSLSLLGCSKMELGNDSFSFAKLKYLRALELREPSMQKLPDSICQLGLLGYLNLSGCSGLKNLPKLFGNLTSLVYINLSGCHGLDDLPKSFSKLNKLEHLDLSFCSCLRELPTALCALTNLRHLNLSHPCCDAVEHKEYLEKVNEARAKVNKLQHPNCHNTNAEEGPSRKIAIPELEGQLAWAVVKVAHDMLASVLGDAAVTIRNGKLVPILEQMKDMMEIVAAGLGDMKRWLMREEAVRLWLKRLENVAYDIWDLVAEIQNNNGAGQMATVLHSSVVASRATKINKQVIESMRKIEEMFDKVVERLTPQPSFGLQETSSLANMDLAVVGREQETRRIIDVLLGSGDAREEAVILPIFGLAGVGKTALAQLVYNHNISQRRYDARVWVYVSPDFDLKRIGKSIILGLQQERYHVDDPSHMQFIMQCLIDLLYHRTRVLIVLDDIWENNQEELDSLKHMLKIHGSKVQVLVTTQDEDIARRICSSNVEPYKLHPLSDDVCWQIIKQTSRFEARDDRKELHKIGREIVTKCGGLPLAAKALGYKLTDMNVEGWSKVRSTDDFSGLNGGFLSSVSLRYKLMPPTEKLCFAYLAILPDRHNMAKDDIIHRWIALGLIKSYDRISTRYQRGEHIISRLLDISFLQHANLASTSGEHGDERVISFAMHDLIHSFARSVMSSMLVIADGEYKRYLERPRHCRCAVLTNFSLPSSKLSGILPAGLWSLSLLGCSKMELNDDSFSFAKYLRVLELRDPSMQRLPGSICQLVLLRYLNLSGCSGLAELPESFGNLTSMLHINLSGCSGLLKLPESFGNLTSVLHINLSGCSGLAELPESFGNLTSVPHINLSGCSGVKNLPKSFGNLTNLVHINLSGCHGLDDLPNSFSKLNKLQYPNCHNTSAEEDPSKKMAIPELEGTLASAVFKVALDMLKRVLGYGAVRMRHWKLELVLSDIEMAAAYPSNMKGLSRLFQKRLEDVAYDIWGMVDEIDEANKWAILLAGMRPRPAVAPNAIKMIREKLEGILRIHYMRFGMEQPSFALQETISLANMDLIVGRDEETHRILDILYSRVAREEAVILPIFGLAGVGKTALAQLVYNHMRRDYHARAWVYVSPDFDLKRIEKSIILGLQQRRYDVNDLSGLQQECIDDIIHLHRRVLVVLDDIWEHNQKELDSLKHLLDEHGSIVHVLVTTRDEDVARKMCTDNVQPYKLHPLSDDLCWQIIKETSRFEARDDKQELDNIGREIATKCRGLPLGAQELGCKLTGRGIEGWSKVRSTGDLFDVYIDDGFSQLNNRFLLSVSLSYKLMPPTERLCFAYLANSPDTHNMAKDDIIHSWIALDLIKPYSRIYTAYHCGEYIISRLLEISFLQDANLASVGTKSLSAMHAREKKRPLTINNVVNDLARYVLGERLVVVDGRNMATSSLSYVNSSRSGLFAFVSNLNATLENLSSILPGAHRILSLRFVGCSNIKITDGAFSSAKKLRLLDLRGCLDNDFLGNAWPDSGTPLPTKKALKRCSVGKLPESVGQLKHLRYLNAPAIQDRVLPLSIINGLSRCLRYLSLRCSRQLSDLTEAFGSMESLEHLDLSGCSGLKSLPKSFGACWRSLLHLDLSGCTGLKTLPQSVWGVGCSSKLLHLDLSGCSCLEGITEALSGCTDLRYLNLSHRCGYSVEDWFHLEGLNDVLPTLKELQFLGISSCLDPLCYAMPAEKSSKYVNCIASLDKLEHLDLSQNKFLRHLPKDIGALRQLRTLDLSMCFKLESLQGIGEVNKLRDLDISGCPQLNPLPEDTQQQLAKLPFLESREWLTSITGPRQAAGSQEERSHIVGGNQAQDRASTSQDAARQLRMDPSSSEPEITEFEFTTIRHDH